MKKVQAKSVEAPPERHLGRLVFEAARRAEAMGLVPPESAPRGNLAGIRQMAARIGRAGIATATAAALDNVETPTADELVGLLETMIAALEASPAPRYEWAGLGRVLDVEALGSLLNVSLSSLKRYQSGERETPDAVAARLHYVALVVGDLSGSYNEIGVRRWFGRKRSLLDGRAPAELLRGEWDPDEAGPARVRELARELISLSAT